MLTSLESTGSTRPGRSEQVALEPTTEGDIPSIALALISAIKDEVSEKRKKGMNPPVAERSEVAEQGGKERGELTPPRALHGISSSSLDRLTS